MANFDTGNLLTAQTMLADKYAQPEMRMKPAPAFQLLTSNDNFLVVDAETLKTRDDRPIEAHLLARTKRNAGTARSYNHTGTIDDSIKSTLAWTTKTDKTSISLKLLNKSVFEFNTVLANKFEQCAMNILESKETEAVTYLRAQRATAQPTLKGASFNGTNDAVEIAATKIARFYQLVRSVMRQNYFNASALDIIADSLLSVEGEFQANQGQSNSTNLGWQQKGLNIVESVELADANYAEGIVLAMPKYGACALNWIPKENRQGWGDYNTYEGGYGVFTFMGYTFAVHGYLLRADTSASNGDTQDVLMEFELSLDTSYNRAPLSTIAGRTDSPIIEFGQLA